MIPVAIPVEIPGVIPLPVRMRVMIVEVVLRHRLAPFAATLPDHSGNPARAGVWRRGLASGA